MKYYRLIDEYGEPYYSGYNETDLKNLAECIYDILQPDEFINPDGEYDLEKIYEGLLAGERDFIIFVEEADKPFEPDGEYGEDSRIENWKDYLFDDLNNILFSKHSELTEYIKKWLIKHKLVDDDRVVGELASDFIDRKELYDLDYED